MCLMHFRIMTSIVYLNNIVSTNIFLYDVDTWEIGKNKRVANVELESLSERKV